MGLSGLVGGGAAEGLEDILARQMLEQQMAERERAQRAQEALASQRLSQDASQHGDMMGLRGRELDQRDTARRDESNRAGVADMERQRGYMDKQTAEAKLAEELSALLSDPSVRPSVKGHARAQRLGIEGTKPENFASPDELEAEDKRRLKNVGAEADARERAQARYRPAPEPKPTGPNGMNAGQLQTAKQFQDDYARDSKTYTTVRNAYQQIAAAAKDPDAAGDLSLIFGYMKMLDPNSVVRETEFANAQNAAGVPDQVRNIWNRAMSGERLNPNQRQQFVGQARKLFDIAKGNQGKVRSTYGSRATKFGIDPSMVLDDEDVVEGIDDGTVKMRAPNGQVKDVPADQVEAFKAKGATVVP